MGVKATTTTKGVNLKEEINKNQFDFLYIVGKGGFGKVWKVESKKFKKQYALKEMSKAKIIDKKSEKSIKYERELLSKLKHPFIVNMQYAFQDYENLYLVMDLLNGGDLRYHISRHRKFSEEQTRFFVACIVLGLEYIHNNNVLHRDIKPENLVLEENGYVRITDFGIAKVYQKENSSETSGTPGYMSPEVMCAQNHTIAVDYFAVGVLVYEFMYGRRPYLGKSRKEIKELIMAKQVQVKPNEIPEGWGPEAADFINRCLQRKPANRLGLRGPQEVKDHPWLKYYPWKELMAKTIEAPFMPKIGDNFDKKYCENPDVIGNDTLERYQKYSRNENFKFIFNNFTYINYLDAIENSEKDGSNTNRSSNYNGISNTNISKNIKHSSTQKYNLNLLKNKVKIVDNDKIDNYESSKNYNNIRSSRSSNKIAAIQNNFYNNYINSNQKNSTQNILESNHANTQRKYSPFREKKKSSIVDGYSNGIVNVSKKERVSSQTSIRNISSGTTSSTNNLINSKIISQKIASMNQIDKSKLSKILGNSTSSNNILLKNYKPSSNSQSSTGSSVTNSLKFYK